MSAKAPTEELKNLKIEAQGTQSNKVDSAVPGVDAESPKPEKKHARKQSTDVVDVKTLDPLSVKFAHDDIASIAWKISEPTTKGNDKEATKKFLTEPPIKSFEFCVQLSETTAGVEFKVVKPKGVTIKDVMDKLSKKYKGFNEEDLPAGPSKTFLKGFKWNPNFEKFVVVLDDEISITGGGASSKKGKKKKGGS